jgi:hypothetical protein
MSRISAPIISQREREVEMGKPERETYKAAYRKLSGYPQEAGETPEQCALNDEVRSAEEKLSWVEKLRLGI